MASLNKVQLIGHLGADPEIKSFQSGDKVANIRVATSESWKDKQTGEKKEKTEWHSVAIFGDGLVGIVERFTRKGSKVYLEGQLQTRKWQDQAGNDRYSTEIVLRPFNGSLILLDGAQRDGNSDGGNSRYGAQREEWGKAGARGAGGGGKAREDLDDDIPF